MAETDAVQVKLDAASGILSLRLNRPDKKNALSLDTLASLVHHLEAARDDDAVRVVLLGAQGDVFSAGGDLQVMRQFAGDAMAAQHRLRVGLNRVVSLLATIPKPVVAQVEGNAYGAGAILAFMCDLPIVAEEATFALSFRHVGLIPDTGATWLLPRRLGLPRAKQLCWTGAPFSGKDAAAWGLALEAAPRSQVATRAGALATALAQGPRATLALTKQALQANAEASLEDALEREARLQAAAFLTAEHAEGRDAFFDRRAPNFP